MNTNRILLIFFLVLTPIIFPIQIVTTFLIGALVTLTFNILLIPLSLVWTLFFYLPLLGLSLLFIRMPFLRPVSIIIGFPLSIAAYIFAALIPSMGDLYSRTSKVVYTESFPFNYLHFTYLTNRSKFSLDDIGTLVELNHRIKGKDPIRIKYIEETFEKTGPDTMAESADYEVD